MRAVTGWISLLALCVLPGCAVIMPHVEDLETFHLNSQDERHSMAQIEFKVVSDIAKTCAPLTGKKEAKACASWNTTLPRKCTVYVESMSTEVIVGHELRHCFEGHFH